MRKVLYYVTKGIQATGLLLILHVLYLSYFHHGSMDLLYKFSFAGMGIFMVGWMLARWF